MTKYPIVIVTNELDHHTDLVLLLLREMGHEPARIHTADIPQHTSLSLSYDGVSWKNILQTRKWTIPARRGAFDLAHEETRYDWRRYAAQTPSYEHKLPAEIAEKCMALTKAYGLNFSTSDLILTPDGRLSDSCR